MPSKAFENELLKSLGMLTREQQNKALAYIKSLLKRGNRHNLLQFAGSLDSVSVNEMSKAIEAGCENIDKNEW